MSYTNIAVALVTLLETVTDASVVYDHEPKEIKDYPAIAISAAGHTNSFGDIAHNRRVYTFNVRCYVRADDVSAAETKVRDMADQIIAAIEGDVTIGGSCDFATPSKGRISFPQKEIPVQAVEITIDATTKVMR